LAIVFSVNDIIWVLENLDTLRSGNWPPSDSGYIDPRVKIQARAKAYFVAPVELEAEIMRRLELCGPDGLMVLCYHSHNHSFESLGNFFRYPEYVIRDKVERCLEKIAGWNFKNKQNRREGKTSRLPVNTS
jgi:hypothetical protein